MTDSQKRMMEKLGLSEQDFKPNPQTDKERITALEEQNQLLIDCILELTEMLYE